MARRRDPAVMRPRGEWRFEVSPWEHFSMKILFLDVDGVLNRCGKSAQGLEGDKLELLRDIVTAAQCEIVLSSTWRKTEHQLSRLKNALWQHDLEIMDCTPVLDRQIGQLWTAETRGKEIRHWLNRQTGITRFVILDDDADMGDLLPHLVKTESFTGLTPAIAQEVIARLTTAN